MDRGTKRQTTGISVPQVMLKWLQLSSPQQGPTTIFLTLTQISTRLVSTTCTFTGRPRSLIMVTMVRPNFPRRPMPCSYMEAIITSPPSLCTNVTEQTQPNLGPCFGTIPQYRGLSG